MARKPNQWNFASTRILDSLVRRYKPEGLADRLCVSTSTIRKWTNGRIPSNRFQVAMANLKQPVTRTNSDSISARITSYLRATRMSRSDFAELAGVSETTLANWINLKSKPRSLRKLNRILQDPRPLAAV